MRKRQTAGELSLKARSDTTKYQSMEVAHALTEDIAAELMSCAQKHSLIFDEPEFCVGYVIASDPLIKGVMRRKFHAMLYLPSPRPNQAMFLFNKVKQQFTKRLWILPNPLTMAELSEMTTVHKSWLTMKQWSDAFFAGKFWQFIRKQHNIDMLSEIEYLKLHREELIKAGCKEGQPLGSNPFDFSKISVDKIVDTKTSLPNQDGLNDFREA